VCVWCLDEQKVTAKVTAINLFIIHVLLEGWFPRI
jgi:hypothetical protein